MTKLTRRQRVTELLKEDEWTFDALRRELELPVHVLSEDLAHIDKSVRNEGVRLHVEPARCPPCGFVFHDRRRFTPPGRCPKCRNQRLRGPYLTVR